jgi:hypothetical protein
MSKASADYNKARRARAKANGLCIQCVREPHLPDRVRCAKCAAWASKYNSTYHYTPAANGNSHRMGANIVKPEQWCDECLAAKFHRAECKGVRP